MNRGGVSPNAGWQRKDDTMNDKLVIEMTNVHKSFGKTEVLRGDEYDGAGGPNVCVSLVAKRGDGKIHHDSYHAWLIAP